MARKRERIFAGFGALLFLGSACALAIFVILQSGSSTNTATTANTTAQTCPETSVNGAAEALPEVFKPVSTVSDLQTTDLAAGTGKVAQSSSCLQVKYYGTLAKDGTVFDENYDKTQAFQFVLGQSEVIPGWDQGLVGMKVGGTRRLVVPAALAYGTTGQGSIPPNADLVFVVHLLSVK